MTTFFEKLQVWILRNTTRANNDMLGYFSVYLACHGLSERTLMKLCYMADWKYSIEYGRTISYSRYELLLGKSLYSNYMDIRKYIKDKKYFREVKQFEYPWNESFFIVPDPGKFNFNRFTEKEKEVLNFVIDVFLDMDSYEFVNLVNSTYPIMTSEVNKTFDLPKLAKDYNEIKHLI